MVDEIADQTVHLLASLLEVVVDNDMVELRSERQLVGCLVDALLDDLGGIGGTIDESSARYHSGKRSQLSPPMSRVNSSSGCSSLSFCSVFHV